MKSIIILSLSQLRENAPLVRLQCPGNAKSQTGIQTNEAPVKYLLSKYPRISEIICLTTPTAQKTAFAHFSAEVKKKAPAVKITQIAVPDDGSLSEQAMAGVIDQLEKDDLVYMDSSGGTRYMVFGLLHLARILEYKGVRVMEIVYANISVGQVHRLDDMTALYHTFDLINGMQELMDFGSIRTLSNYYRKDPSGDGKIMRDLLAAIEKMTDAITLCRLKQLEAAMQQYQQALNAADHLQNAITQELVEIFKRKFGTNISILWAIRWCLEHRMLTQALSLYREWMPKYILRESGLFTELPKLEEKWKENKYQDENVFLWKQLMNLSQPPEESDKNLKYLVETLTNLPRYLRGSGFAVMDVRKVEQLGWDSLYVQTLRNMIVHSNDSATIDFRIRNALKDHGYPSDFENLPLKELIHPLLQALRHAESL